MLEKKVSGDETKDKELVYAELDLKKGKGEPPKKTETEYSEIVGTAKK